MVKVMTISLFWLTANQVENIDLVRGMLYDCIGFISSYSDWTKLDNVPALCGGVIVSNLLCIKAYILRVLFELSNWLYIPTVSQI